MPSNRQHREWRYALWMGGGTGGRGSRAHVKLVAGAFDKYNLSRFRAVLRRETVRNKINKKFWWRVMFAFVLDSAMSNAYLLYCTQWDQADDTRRGNKKDRTDFHCAVVRGLCEGTEEHERTVTICVRRRGRPRAQDMLSAPTQPKSEAKMARTVRQGDLPLHDHRCRVQALRKGEVWRHCMHCRWYKDAKGTGNMRKTKSFCALCGSPLCENCFEHWHGGEWMPHRLAILPRKPPRGPGHPGGGSNSTIFFFTMHFRLFDGSLLSISINRSLVFT